MTTYFSETWTGTNGAGWGANWTNGRTGTGASATIQTNKGRQNAGTNSATVRADRYSGTNRQDVELSGKFTVVSSSTAGSFEVWIRGSDVTNPGNVGLFLYMVLGQKPELHRGNGFSYDLVATLSSAPTLAQSTEYGFKLYAVGSSVKAKVWATGSGEPASYDVTPTVTTETASGQAWVQVSNGGGTTNFTVDWDDFLYTDGVTVQSAAGTVAATSGVSGAATGIITGAAGTVAATTSVSGDVTKAPAQAAGTVAATSSVSGDVTIAHYGVSGTVAATSGVSGGITVRLLVSGTVAASSGASGALTAFLLASGTVQAFSSVSGGILVAGKPGQGSEVLVLFNPDEVLTGGRVTYYQFDLLDSEENFVGHLQGVDSGDVAFDAYSSVKSTGSLTVHTDPAYAHLPDGQPDFLGVQINTPTGPQAVATSGATAPAEDFVCADADAALISVGDRVILTDSSSQPKLSTAFTVMMKTSLGGGETAVRFTPTSSAAIVVGDLLKVVSVSFEQRVDWLNVRIRPMIRIARLGGGDDPEGTLVPVGVYLCAAPVEEWDDSGLTRKVELADKLSILDQDIADGDPDPNTVAAYSIAAGDNIIGKVKEIIAAVGETSPAIEPAAAVAAAPMVWDIGATWLRVVNDLLDSAGYFSLYCDGYGRYRAEPYVQPANRVPVYESIAPFSDGPESLMDPSWTHDRDIYSIPNRYLVVGQGNGTTAALTSVATNEDPSSPYSYPSRGRWITAVEIGVEAVDQAALDTIARARLSRASSITNQLTVKHVFLPDLKINSVVKFVNPDSGLDTYCYVVNTSVVFDPTALCQSVMRLVT